MSSADAHEDKNHTMGNPTWIFPVWNRGSYRLRSCPCRSGTHTQINTQHQHSTIRLRLNFHKLTLEHSRAHTLTRTNNTRVYTKEKPRQSMWIEPRRGTRVPLKTQCSVEGTRTRSSLKCSPITPRLRMFSAANLAVLAASSCFWSGESRSQIQTPERTGGGCKLRQAFS